uniref:Uncharacterized protein n=1 Tax=Serinus canaria TaxID=9135 RepID=A0A8C9MP46_SERCA
MLKRCVKGGGGGRAVQPGVWNAFQAGLWCSQSCSASPVLPVLPVPQGKVPAGAAWPLTE